MKITDKQRIDFVQRHRLRITVDASTWFVGKLQEGFQINLEEGRTWRQAVDKAIKSLNHDKSN